MLFAVLLAAHAALRFGARLDDRLPPELDGVEMTVHGVVASLPQAGTDHLSFLFRPTKRYSQIAGLPSRLLVRWYEDYEPVEPGEAWAFRLRLRPPRALVNFQGIDRERNWFAAGTGALASVVDDGGERLGMAGAAGADQLRLAIRHAIQGLLAAGPERALVLSLAIADRSELGPELWRLLAATGTGHLLAISGLHLGLAAVAGFWLCRLFLFPLPWRGRSEFMACCTGSLLAAAAYGVLAGFPVSTQRALIMLAAGLAVLAGRRAVAPLRAWLLALAAVMVLDVFSPLYAGFWFSFGAVWVLIAVFSPRSRHYAWWSGLLRAQAGIMLVLLPMSAFWFQSGSWLAFPANLLAIPWVSFIVVPLVLAGVALLPEPALAGPVLALAARSCGVLVHVLDAMDGAGGGHAWLTPRASLPAAALAAVGGAALLLPRGLALRGLGACLLATLVLPRDPQLKRGDFSVEALDVGQGLAVVVRTRAHTLLYDTGPGDGLSWSLFRSVIAPALAAAGRAAPDLVVVSHGDLDHAGGLADARRRYPDVPMLANTASPLGGVQPCHDGRSWSWDGVEFRVLHPSPWLPYRGNDSSCVIRIDNGRQRALLTGDIGAAVEQRLAARGSAAGEHHGLVTVPHHGSASSSSLDWLHAARPRLAVASAAHGNRFGFPKPEVVARYQALGARLLSTSDCGAVRVVISGREAPAVHSARLDRGALWRWPAGAGCAAAP